MIQVKKFSGQTSVTDANTFLSTISNNNVVSVYALSLGEERYGDIFPTIIVVFKT